MSDPNAAQVPDEDERSEASGGQERTWNQWNPDDPEVILAAEAAAAREAEGTQTLPAYPEGIPTSEPYTGEDEVASVDEAREEAKAKAEARREQQKAEQSAERTQAKQTKPKS